MGDIREAIRKVVKGKWGKPVSSFKLTFDSPQAQIEPTYYWILDFIQDAGWETKKLIDNFTSSPGSGHFSDMGQRVSIMQEKGTKILGDINQVVKSILNLIYDLKEFEIRLEHYEDARSEDKNKRESGMLALKQIWLDNVDLKRGRGSIHQMAMEVGFTTIREIFMIANSIEDLKKMNKDEEGGLINDQVMRVLIPRIEEFLKWKEYSEKELRKRMNIEKSYLKSQIESLKLYSQWLKPYIKAAEDLRQKGFDGNAALVNAFSTSLFELELFGKKEIKEAPKKFEGYKLKRKYHPIIVIDMKYRGHISQRVTQRGDYAFAGGGRVDITFDSYALNEEELKLVEKEMEKEDLEDSMKFSMDMAAEALKELEEDIDHFLKNDEKKEKEKKEEKKAEDINPFKVLIDLFRGKTSKKEKEKEVESYKDIKPDNYVEKTVRALAAESAAGGLYAVYDIYKKSHGMASPPKDFENEDSSKISEPGVNFGDVFKGRG